MPTGTATRRARLAFRPDALGLEPRRLMAARLTPLQAASAPYVSYGFGGIEFRAGRDGGDVPIRVYRHGTVDAPLHVRVAPDGEAPGIPTTPVDVEFAPGETTKLVSIPTGEPARGAGDLDVTLRMDLVSSQPGVAVKVTETMSRATLKLVDRDDPVPPRVVAARITRKGIELTFSEPMDPKNVVDPRSYLLAIFGRRKSFRPMDIFENLTPTITELKSTPSAVRSVSYDPTRQVVTIVPARRIDPSGSVLIGAGHSARDLRGLRPGPEPDGPLTDLAGNPVENFGGPHGGTLMAFTRPPAPTPPGLNGQFA